MNVIRHRADEVLFMYNDFVAVSIIINFIIDSLPVANDTGISIYMPDYYRHLHIPARIRNDHIKQFFSALLPKFGYFNTSEDSNLFYQSLAVVFSQEYHKTPPMRIGLFEPAKQ